MKDNAGWEADKPKDDNAIVSGIKCHRTNNIMTMPPMKQGARSGNVIPGWIKINAGW